MPSWSPGAARRAIFCILALTVALSGCGGGVLKKEYEYEEDLYLSLDGSVTLYVNASVPALVSLRGVDLDVSPRSRFDRRKVRALFEAPGVDVTSVSATRRDGRRFVHVRLEAEHLSRLPSASPFRWSSYQFGEKDGVYEYRQVVGAPAGTAVGNVGWTGGELVAFRLHLPSRIPYHNAPSRRVERGNILVWEQPLPERLKGAPIEMHVRMETESILFTTLMLFASTIVAAAVVFALLLWWIARRGRDSEVAESRP